MRERERLHFFHLSKQQQNNKKSTLLSYTKNQQNMIACDKKKRSSLKILVSYRFNQSMSFKALANQITLNNSSSRIRKQSKRN